MASRYGTGGPGLKRPCAFGETLVRTGCRCMPIRAKAFSPTGHGEPQMMRHAIAADHSRGFTARRRVPGLAVQRGLGLLAQRRRRPVVDHPSRRVGCPRLLRRIAGGCPRIPWSFGHPFFAGLTKRLLNRGPCRPVGDLFLTRIAAVGLPGVIEGFAVNALRCRRQMLPDGGGKGGIGPVGHGHPQRCERYRLARRAGARPRRSAAPDLEVDELAKAPAVRRLGRNPGRPAVSRRENPRRRDPLPAEVARR